MVTNITGIGIANAIGFRRYIKSKGGETGDISYPGLIAAWSAKGKSNDDTDRATLRDLTGNGHDIALNGFAFSEMSGYGGYNVNFSNWNNYVNDHKILLSNSKKASRIYATYLPSFKIKVSGLNGETLQYFIKVTSNNITFNIRRDGEYVLPKGVEEDINSESYYHEFALYNTTEDITNIIIEQLPEYPDALVFDGVDDYGETKNIPMLQDYTIIINREILTKPGYAPIIASIYNGYPQNGGTLNSMVWYEGSSYTQALSFGIKNNVIINKAKSITYQSKNSYNQQTILYGSYKPLNEQTFELASLNHGYFANMAFYSAYLFDRSLDEQEIKAFIRKYIDPDYILPSEQTT